MSSLEASLSSLAEPSTGFNSRDRVQSGAADTCASRVVTSLEASLSLLKQAFVRTPALQVVSSIEASLFSL